MKTTASAGSEFTIHYPADLIKSPVLTDGATRTGRIVLSSIWGVMLLLVAWAGVAGAPSKAPPVVSQSNAEALQNQERVFQAYSNQLARGHERAARDGDESVLPSQF